MDSRETAITFDCAWIPTIGIVHNTEKGSDLGVLIVVGGPQYRVGSHRQFVLLARALANAGLPTLRFDQRGLGDCADGVASFENLQQDIECAVDTLIQQTGVKHVVLWGLCDAASAILMYAASDPRISSIVLLNPWVHTETSEARVRLKTYYISRLRSREFWRKLFRLDVKISASLKSFFAYAQSARRRSADTSPDQAMHFIERMRTGLESYTGHVFLILSGNDLTAAEFRSLLESDPRWRTILTQKLTGQLNMDDANHTFASRQWRETVEQQTIEWVYSMEKAQS